MHSAAAAAAAAVTQAVADLRARGKSDKEVENFSVLFKEVQQQIDAKQLRPFIRTQYMRTAFQVSDVQG
jgi:SPX domain protein involved in polyphosphate accumulation